MPGYPDWQRVDTRVQAALFYAAALPVTLLVNVGTFYVANLERVMFSMILTGSGAYKVRVLWYNDQALSQLVAETDVVINTDSFTWRQSLPVVSQWMKVQTVPITAGGGDTMQVSIVPNSNPVPLSQSNSPLVIAQDGVSIGAGATPVFTSGFVIPGPAVVSANSISPKWFLNVQFLNNAGTWQNLDQWNQGAASLTVNADVVLPSAPVRLQIGNQDVSAHTFVASLGSKTY